MADIGSLKSSPRRRPFAFFAAGPFTVYSLGFVLFRAGTNWERGNSSSNELLKGLGGDTFDGDSLGFVLFRAGNSSSNEQLKGLRVDTVDDGDCLGEPEVCN